MATKAELEAELERLRQLPAEHPESDQLHVAQGLIANAADWTSRLPESETWRTAARRWLDEYTERLRASIAERGQAAEEESTEEPAESTQDRPAAADQGED